VILKHGEVEVFLRPTVSRQVCPGVRPLSGTVRPIFLSSSVDIIFRELRVSYYKAPSRQRGWVCNLIVNIIYCLIRDSQNLEGQVPVFISPRNRVAQLYPLELSSPFIAVYDTQGYGGAILTRLHAGYDSQTTELLLVIYSQHGSHRKLLPCCLFFSCRGTVCPQSCSLATTVVLSPVYTAVTWRWFYVSRYFVFFHSP
jgi:hypothetical protein